MGTATANNRGIQRAWGSSSFSRTIDDVEAEEVITVNANYPGAMAQVISILRDHNAYVSSGYGCRLTRILGSQFYIKAPRDQIERIHEKIAQEFPAGPKPAASAEEFCGVDRWIPTHEINLFVDRDRKGVLATAFDVIDRHDVNVVTMAASTGATMNKDSDAPSEVHWGNVTIKASVERVASFWEEFKAVARREGWKKASVVPVRGPGDPYYWSREREVNDGV